MFHYHPKLKREPDEHSQKIRSRVVNIMRSVITKHPEIRKRKDFAKSIHAAQASVSRWESHAGMPTLENIADICEIYTVSPAYILLGQGNPWGDAETIVRIEMLEKRLEKLEKQLSIPVPKKNKK